LTNERIVQDQKVLNKQTNWLICKEKTCQFNHVVKDGVQIGEDFQLVSTEMWRMLVRHFSFIEVSKRKRKNNETQKVEAEFKPILPLVRSFEKIGLGIRTQMEYFYPKFQVRFISACPEQLQPVSLYMKQKYPSLGLFEI